MLNAFDDTPKKLESVHVQRDGQNQYYEQVVVSGSDLIVYHDETGKLTADKISAFKTKYNLGGGGSSDASISASWASSSLSSSYIEFNGNRSIKRSGYTGINVGGDNISEFLENFFFPFVSATVALNSGTTTYETGSVQSVSVNNTITQNDETSFGTGSIVRDGVVWNTWASIPPYTYNVTETGISSSHTYKTYVQVDNDGSPTLISTSTKTISFGYPFLWGTSTQSGLTGSALYTSTVSHSYFSQQNVGPTPIYGSGVYIYFAYPSNYGDLVSITDPNNFEALPSFEYSGSVPVTSSGLTNDWMRTYKVYKLKLLASPNGNFTFKFS